MISKDRLHELKKKEQPWSEVQRRKYFHNTHLWKPRFGFEIFVSPIETNLTLEGKKRKKKKNIGKLNFKFSTKRTLYIHFQVIGPLNEILSNSTKQAPLGRKDKQSKDMPAP